MTSKSNVPRAADVGGRLGLFGVCSGSAPGLWTHVCVLTHSCVCVLREHTAGHVNVSTTPTMRWEAESNNTVVLVKHHLLSCWSVIFHRVCVCVWLYKHECWFFNCISVCVFWLSICGSAFININITTAVPAVPEDLHTKRFHSGSHEHSAPAARH